MPWCPVCKNEYQEGVKTCADCGAELVESLKERKEVPLANGPCELIGRMRRFMEYNSIPVVFEEAGDNAGLYVLPKYEEKAKTAAQVFLAGEQARMMSELSRENTDDPDRDGREPEKSDTDTEEKDLAQNSGADEEKDAAEADARTEEGGGEEAGDEIEEEIEDEITEETAGFRKVYSGGVYQKKRERADEMKSSGQVLLIGGVLGCVIMLLIDFGIIPIRPGNMPMMNVIMFALFFLFIGFGIFSLRGARKAASEASGEEEQTEKILTWARETLTARGIDSQAKVGKDDSEEICFFKRTELMKKKIADEFGGLEENYIDSLTETLYQEIFE